MNRSALATGCSLVAGAAVVGWVSAPPPVGSVIAGQPFIVDAATDFTAAQIAAGDALSAATVPWALAAQVVPLLLALAIGLSPAATRMARAVRQWVRGRDSVASVLLVGMAFLVLAAAAAPFRWQVRQARAEAGLVTQSASGWLRDVCVSSVITMVVAAVFVVVVAAARRRWAERWWMAGAFLAGVGVLVLTFLQPLIIEPLFNRFTSLEHGPLRSSLIELAQREGVQVDDVLVADASRRTTTLNGYVSGLGASRRIVLYDTLLDQASDDEVRAVVAHEVAHAAHHDVPRAAVLGAVGAAGAVALLAAALSTRPARRRRDVAGDEPLAAQPLAAEPALADAVLLAVALVLMAGTVVTPYVSALSRRVEARADASALDATGDPVAAARLHQRLALTAHSDLTPSVPLHAWFGTHPTAPERIALARAWSAEFDGPEVPSLADAAEDAP